MGYSNLYGNLIVYYTVPKKKLISWHQDQIAVSARPKSPFKYMNLCFRLWMIGNGLLGRAEHNDSNLMLLPQSSFFFAQFYMFLVFEIRKNVGINVKIRKHFGN